MELAIINGTYRDSNTKVAAAAGTSCKSYLPIEFLHLHNVHNIYLLDHAINFIRFVRSFTVYDKL